VVVLDKLDYCATLNNLGSVWEYPNFHFIKGDVQSADLVMHVLHSEGVDVVMHFAAQTHVDNSFGNSLAFTLNNTHGTHVLLEACRVYGRIKRFINVSTDEVYGETSLGSTTGLTEASRLEPTNPYSAAKAGAEMIARAYHTSYGLPVIVTRGNNVYGPHQFPEKMIPKFTLRAMRGEDLPIHGDGMAVRSYLYVDDVADAFLVVLARGTVGEVYNIGTKRERTVVDVARDICALFGRDPSTTVRHVRDRAFNDRRYFICDRKLEVLGWKERMSWDEGLKKTVEWYASTPVSYWDHGVAEAALEAHPQPQEAVRRKETRGTGGAPLEALRRKPTVAMAPATAGFGPLSAA
jgi:dTDP-glucose 4,6-dehydratase